MIFPTQEIEEKLGYTFHDKGLLKQAFTHSSYANIWGDKDNERMEYLGDAVLQLVVTEWQYEKDNRAEGKLSALRQHFVRKEALDSLLKRHIFTAIIKQTQILPMPLTREWADL